MGGGGGGGSGGEGSASTASPSSAGPQSAIFGGSVPSVIKRIQSDDPSVVKMSLYGRSLGDAGAAGLSEALRGNTHLAVLDLGRNGITAAGTAAVASALAGDYYSDEGGVDGGGMGDGVDGQGGGGRRLGRAPCALETLWLRENLMGTAGVQALSDALSRNGTLTGLSLGRNGINREGGRLLAAALRRNTALTQLWLYGNELGDGGCSSLAESLLVNSTLRELYLGGNGITDLGAKDLGSMLGHNSALAKLELYRNDVTDAGASYLADGLRVNGGLVDLNVRGNRIGPGGCTALVSALETNGTVGQIDLRENELGDVDLDRIEYLVGGLSRLCIVLLRGEQASVRHLDAVRQRRVLADSAVEDAGVGIGMRAGAPIRPSPVAKIHPPTFNPRNLDDVCHWLAENDPSLSSVDLSDLGLGDAGLEHLAGSLTRNTHLRSLDFRNNNVTYEGVETLSCVLRDVDQKSSDTGGNGDSNGIVVSPPSNGGARAEALGELNLGWNDVLDAGAISLSLSLQANRSLLVLYMNNAALGDEGAAALAELLRRDTPLEILHLRHNSIGCDGVALLSAALLNNTHLHSLLMGWNDVGQAGAE